MLLQLGTKVRLSQRPRQAETCRSSTSKAEGWAVTSIIPFIGNAMFEPADIKLMSDDYRGAIEDVYEFGHPNKIVEQIMASRIIALTNGGERNLKRLQPFGHGGCLRSPLKQPRYWNLVPGTAPNASRKG